MPLQHYMWKYCGEALLLGITLHSSLELTQSSALVQFDLMAQQGPCQSFQKGPLLMEVGAMWLFGWLVDSLDDIRDMPGTTCKHCHKCSANKNEP